MFCRNMTYLIIVSALLAAGSIISGLSGGDPLEAIRPPLRVYSEITCGRDEVIDNCPVDCPYDYCPKDEHQDAIPCPKPKECPPAKCKCGFNYRMAENGTCIPTTECPPFECSRPNEVYQSCSSYCPSDDCSDATALGICPYWLLIAVNCSPRCKCIKHFWKTDGVCVPYEACPNVAARKAVKAETPKGYHQDGLQ